MEEKQFKRAIEIYNRLNALNEVKKSIANIRGCRLYYAYKKCNGDYTLCSDWSMRPIAEILDKHDKMIREGIDEEIRKLQEEIKTL